MCARAWHVCVILSCVYVHVSVFQCVCVFESASYTCVQVSTIACCLHACVYVRACSLCLGAYVVFVCLFVIVFVFVLSLRVCIVFVCSF